MIPDIYRLAIRKSLKLVFKNIYNQKTLKGLSVFFIKTKHKSNYTQVFRVKMLWNDAGFGKLLVKQLRWSPILIKLKVAAM